MTPNTHPGDGRTPRELRAESQLASDIEGLRRSSAERLPSIEDTARLVREESRLMAQEGLSVKILRNILTHPGRAAALAAAAIAVALLVLPVSYQRTVGYEARLAIAGTPDGGTLPQLAREWKGLLGATRVQVEATASESGATTTLIADLPRQSRASVEAAAQGFARALAAKGIRATAEVQPKVERTLGTLYAMAAERVQEIRVDGKGKTDAQVEAEIRSRLEAVGMANPEVHVKRADGQTQITIQSKGGPGAKSVEPRVTLDGDAPKTDAHHKAVRVEVHRTPGMTDDQLKAEVSRQLKSQGEDADVQVVNGQIEIHKRK